MLNHQTAKIALDTRRARKISGGVVNPR